MKKHLKQEIKAFDIYSVRWRFIASRTPEDVEKMVLPSIIYINTNHKEFKETRRKGFMICFGWWDWSIKIGAII